MDLVDTTTDVETPERVRFRYRVAGPGLRATAWLLDLMVQASGLALVGLVVMVVPFLFSVELAGFSVGGGLLVVFIVTWFYSAAFEALWAGQTPGKRVMGLRVVRTDGGPIRVSHAVLRNLLRAADSLPFGYAFGVLSCTVDAKMRRIGDLVGGTMVIVESRSRLLEAVPVEPPVTEEERRDLPLRVDLSRSEQATIEELLRRRARLTPERVEELASFLGPALGDRTGIRSSSWLRVLTLAYARAVGRER